MGLIHNFFVYLREIKGNEKQKINIILGYIYTVLEIRSPKDLTGYENKKEI